MMVERAGQSHRIALWEAMLDAEMNVIYWDVLCRRFTGRDRWLKFIIALTSSGTAIAAWSIWLEHPSTWRVITGIACVLSVYHSFFFPSERVSRVSGLLATWKEMMIRYQLLWERNPDLDTAETWADFEDARLREFKMDESIVKPDEKLRERAYRQVLRTRGLI